MSQENWYHFVLHAGVSLTSISAFDEDNLNVFQFVQLMETFMGTQHVKVVFDNLVDFVHANYAESKEERQERLEKVSHKDSFWEKIADLYCFFMKMSCIVLTKKM